MTKTYLTIMTGAAMLLLSSCDGIFSDIYDTPDAEEINGFGFLAPSTTAKAGKIYIDATGYTDWVYIDFDNMATKTISVYDEAPEHWDIAVHRYDAKTNGGMVAETGATGFNSFSSLLIPQESAFKHDIFTTETIITDMSQMMDGILGYVESDYNAELSRWLNVDKSSMPPIYTLSNKVYIVRFDNGNQIALKLSDFMDQNAVKGFLTIEYMYPFNPN